MIKTKTKPCSVYHSIIVLITYIKERINSNYVDD